MLFTAVLPLRLSWAYQTLPSGPRQRAHAGALKRRCMDEHVLAAVVRWMKPNLFARYRISQYP